MTGADNLRYTAALIGIPYSYANPTDVVHTNILGTLNVLNAALDDTDVPAPRIFGVAQDPSVSEVPLSVAVVSFDAGATVSAPWRLCSSRT